MKIVVAQAGHEKNIKWPVTLWLADPDAKTSGKKRKHTVEMTFKLIAIDNISDGDELMAKVKESLVDWGDAFTDEAGDVIPYSEENFDAFMDSYLRVPLFKGLTRALNEIQSGDEGRKGN